MGEKKEKKPYILSNHDKTRVRRELAQEKRHWIKQSEASFPRSIVSCLSDAVRFRKVLLWVLEGTETQGPLQICLVCKIFSKKSGVI